MHAPVGGSGGGARSSERRRGALWRGIVWVGVPAVVAATLVVAAWLAAPSASDATVSLLAGSSLTVTLESSTDGTSTAPDAVEVETRTYATVAGAFGSLADGSTATVPVTIEGLSGVVITGADVEARPDSAVIALTGRTTAVLGQSFSPATDVMVVIDWDELDPADADPRVLVSALRTGGELGELLGVDDGSLVAAAPLVAGAVSVSDELDAPAPVGGEVLMSPAAFPTTAAGLFAQVYGTPVPTGVPLRGSVNFQARAVVGEMSPAVNAAFGLAAAEARVLEGSVPTPVADFPATGTDAIAGLTLTDTAPTSAPGEVTALLSLAGADPQGRLGVAASDQGTPSDPADDRLQAGWTADGPTALTAPLPSVTVPLSAQVIDVGGDDVSVRFAAALGTWAQPLAVDWLSLADVRLEASFDGRRSSTGDPDVRLDVALRGDTTFAGQDLTVAVHGSLDDPVNATLALDLVDPVTVADYLTAVGASADPSVPANVLDSNLGPASVVVDATTPPASPTVVTVTVEGEFEFLPTATAADPLAASFFGQFVEGAESDTTVAVIPRGQLRLSDLVPGADPDFTLASADLGLAWLMTTSPIVAPGADQIGGRLGAFLAPAYEGFPQAEVDIPSGFSVVGEVPLPDDIAGFVNETLGMRRSVHVRGVLPFGPVPSLDLEMGLSLDPARTPDWVAAGDLTLSVTQSFATVKVDLTGSLTVKLRAGLPSDVAATLGDLGVDVYPDLPVAADYTGCPGGSEVVAQVTEAGLEHRCYDLITFSAGGSLSFTAGSENKVKAQVALQLDTAAMGPDYGWSPFGLSWLEVNNVGLVAALEYRLGGANPGAGVSFGASGDVTLGGTDLLFAARISQSVMAKPPFVKVGLDGFRLSSDAGFGLSDFFPLQHQIASTAALVNQLDPGSVPPAFDPSTIAIPDVQLRNVDLSFSTTDNSDLCIPMGLYVSADLYVDPTGSSPSRGDKCSDDGIPTTPPPGTTCGENADIGCIAGVRLALGKNGFKALAEINGFSLGPILFDGAKLDLELSNESQHLILAGGVGIDPIGSGELNVSIERVGAGIQAQFAGKVDVGPSTDPLFTALADGVAAFSLDDFESSGIQLRVVLDASNLDLGELGQAFADEASAAIDVAAADVIAVLDELSAAITAFRDDPTGFVNTGLNDLGVTIPPEMQPLIDGIADLLAEGFEAGEDAILRGDLPGLPAAGVAPVAACEDLRQLVGGRCYDQGGEPDPDGTPNGGLTPDACADLRQLVGGRCYDQGGEPDPDGTPNGGADSVCPFPQEKSGNRCYAVNGTPDADGTPNGGVAPLLSCADLRQLVNGRCYDQSGEPDADGTPNGGWDPILGGCAAYSVTGVITLYNGRCYFPLGIPDADGTPNGGVAPLLSCADLRQLVGGRCYDQGGEPDADGTPDGGLDPTCTLGRHLYSNGRCYDLNGDPDPDGTPNGGVDPICAVPQEYFAGRCYAVNGTPDADGTPNGGVDPICSVPQEYFAGRCYAVNGTPDADGTPNGGVDPVFECDVVHPFAAGGRCYTVPPIDVPGLCDVFGLSPTCTTEDMIDGVVKPVVLDAANITNEVFQSVADVLQAVSDAFALECASFQVVLNGQQQSVTATITMRVGTESKTFTLGWDLSQPLATNLEGLLAGIEGAASTGCTPVDFGAFAAAVFGTDGGELFNPIGIAADSYTVEEGRTIVVDPLANDTYASQASVTSAVVTGGGPGGLTATIDDDGRRVVLAGAGPLAAGQNGTFTLAYDAVNASGQTVSGTVPVTVVGLNDPPAAVDDSAVLDLRAAAAVTVDVLANDADPETGSALTVGSITPSPIGGCAAVGPGETIGLEATRCDGSPSSFYASLGEGESLVDFLYYSAEDSLGARGGATVDVTVTGVNDAPAVTSILVSRRDLTVGDSVRLVGGFTDPDTGDAHSVTVDWGDGTQSTHPVTPGARVFRADHTYAVAGAHAVVATLSDGLATVDSAAVPITVADGVAAPPVVITPGGAVVLEGDAGTTIAEVTVTLDTPAPAPVTVGWATGDIPSNPRIAHPGSDVVAASGTVTFAPGQTEATVPIEIIGDTLDELPLVYGEWALVTFSDPSPNAVIDTSAFFGLGIVIVLDDDPPPTLVPGAVIVNPEGDAGSTVWDLPVTLSAPSGAPISVDWTIADIPGDPTIARPGSDVVAASGTVTFAPGQTEATVPIEIIGDTLDEPPFIYGEWGFVSFSGPVNVTLDPAGGFFGLGVFVVIDDD